MMNMKNIKLGMNSMYRLRELSLNSGGRGEG